jgi:hypothetical protein
MYEAAETYAETNGAELVGPPDIDPRRLTVTVEVRHTDAVPGTDIRSTASATAGITLSGGLCVGDDGLGWLIDGLCLSEPEPVPDDGGSEEGDPGGDGSGDGDSGDGDDEPDDEPDWTPPEVDAYSSDVVLVH